MLQKVETKLGSLDSEPEWLTTLMAHEIKLCRHTKKLMDHLRAFINGVELLQTKIISHDLIPFEYIKTMLDKITLFVYSQSAIMRRWLHRVHKPISNYETMARSRVETNRQL